MHVVMRSNCVRVSTKRYQARRTAIPLALQQTQPLPNDDPTGGFGNRPGNLHFYRITAVSGWVRDRPVGGLSVTLTSVIIETANAFDE